MESSQSVGSQGSWCREAPSMDPRNYGIDGNLIWSPKNSNKVHGGNRAAEGFGYLLLDDSMSVPQMEELSQWQNAVVTVPPCPLEGRLSIIREDSYNSDVEETSVNREASVMRMLDSSDSSASEQPSLVDYIPLQDAEERATVSQPVSTFSKIRASLARLCCCFSPRV